MAWPKLLLRQAVKYLPQLRGCKAYAADLPVEEYSAPDRTCCSYENQAWEVVFSVSSRL
jgi:hypothetical protein